MGDFIMTSDLQSLAPSLGGAVKDRTGREPGLSRVYRCERTAAVARLIGDLRSSVTHIRFNAALGLADYADHPRAVGGMIRTVRDEARLVSLAAIFGLGWIGDRLTDEVLRAHAITVLGCILKADPPLKIGAMPLRLFRFSLTPPESAAGRALWAEIMRQARLANSMYLRDAATAALTSIGTADALAVIEASQ